MRPVIFAIGVVVTILGIILFMGLRWPYISTVEDYILNLGPQYYEIITAAIIVVGVLLMLIGFFTFNMGKWFKYY